MPELMSTGALEAQSTTTGAMMEFLGGDIGQYLPFGSDAATSTIPLSDFDWAIPTTAAEEAALVSDVEKLIAETSPHQGQQAPATDDLLLPTTRAQECSYDFTMEDPTFDEMELNFDGVFDMPMDETFAPLDQL